MSGRTLLVVGLALACGLAAAVGIQAMNSSSGAPKVETRPVVFATADLRRGEALKDASLEVRPVPLDQVPAGAVEKLTETTDRVVHIPMLKGDAVVEGKLAPKGSGAGMAALIRPGMRAFTIQTPTLSSSLAGFLLPGNRVDVLLTVSSQGGPDNEAGGAATTTLLQNVEILAVHTTVDTPATNKIDPEAARSVTLLVTPEDASLLDLGQNKGTLHLSLRNPKDQDLDAKPRSATVADFRFPWQQRPKPAPSPAPSAPVEPSVPIAPPLPPEVVYTVRTLRGSTVGADRLTVRRPHQHTAPAPVNVAGP